MKPKKKISKQTADPSPKTYESFRAPWGLDINAQHEPFCFNGEVGVRKYRTTVELIEEPLQIIHERLEALWLACDNHLHWQPLQNAAQKYGYVFKGERGSLRANKKQY